MHLSANKTPLWVSQFCALACAMLLCAASTAFGQGRGGSGGGGGMGEPPKPKDSDRGGTSGQRETGSGSGWIMRYVPPKEGESEDVLAILTFKPPGKTPPVKLRVMRDEPVKINLKDNKEFLPEDYPDILTRGLFCNFNWKVVAPEPGKRAPRNPPKDLTSVSFDDLEISGKIVEVRSESLVIRGRPVNDQPWPDADIGTTGRSGAQDTKKRVPIRRLELRIIDDVTKFVDSADKPLEAVDFEPNHVVEAKIVYGRRGGIALSVKSPTLISEFEEEDRSADGRGGGRPPPPPPPG